MNDKQVLQDVAFNPAAKCSPTATQCPRCNNPHNACDKDAQPAGKDAWLETAERLHAVCEKRLIAMADDDLPEDEFMAAPDRYQEAKNALRAHLRSHPAAPEGFDWSLPIPESTIQKAARLLHDQFKDSGRFNCTIDEWANKARAWHFNAVAISEALIAAAGKE